MSKTIMIIGGVETVVITETATVELVELTDEQVESARAAFAQIKKELE